MNAQQVLSNVEIMLDEMDNGNVKRYRIDDVFEDLGIFDWWEDYLSKKQLQDMRKFLSEAIKLGFIGHVCFKVGACDCANGMWACKEESTTGYSPEGAMLYKSFAPDYNYWSWRDDEGNWFPTRDAWDSLKTIRQLEDAMNEKRATL